MKTVFLFWETPKTKDRSEMNNTMNNTDSTSSTSSTKEETNKSALLYKRLKEDLELSTRSHNLALRMIELIRDAISPDFWVLANEFGVSFWIPTREVLKLLMTTAPRWEKSPAFVYLVYSATVDGIRVLLYAKEGALPSTCKIVEETRVLPKEPAKPQRTEIRRVLKCDLE